MKIELVSMGWLPYVRRGMRKAGIRLTVRWGKVYTVMATETRQPDSAAQQARTFSRFFHRILLSCMFFPQRDKLPAKPKSEEVRNRDY